MLEKRTHLTVRRQQAHHLGTKAGIAGTLAIQVGRESGGVQRQRLVEDGPQTLMPIAGLGHSRGVVIGLSRSLNSGLSFVPSCCPRPGLLMPRMTRAVLSLSLLVSVQCIGPAPGDQKGSARGG